MDSQLTTAQTPKPTQNDLHTARYDNLLNKLSSGLRICGFADVNVVLALRYINITAENLSAANSRLGDADVAVEASVLQSLQTLTDDGLTMLAATKVAPGRILPLIYT